jgi:branched-chain amino acid transport system substrate-binding protein
MWPWRTRARTSELVRLAAAVLAAPLATGLVACGSGPAVDETAPPVRIGAIYDLSGARAMYDAPSLDGARLAVERINMQGGLMGRRVELLERDGQTLPDGQTSPDGVRRATASLVASGCSAIVGLSESSQVLAAAPIAARAGVPFITSGATSTRLTREVPRWLFLACFADNAQAAASAQYATDQLGAGTAAILYDRQTEYTRGLARYFERSFRAQGGVVVAMANYKHAGQAAARLKEAAAESGGGPADVVFVAAEPDEAARLLLRLRAAGYRQPIMGGDSFAGPASVKAAEASGGKVYFTTHAGTGASASSRAVRRFDTSYQAAFGRAPVNAFAPLGYDAVTLVAAAIERAESAKPARIREALLKTRRFAGVTGTLSYDGKSRMPRKKVTVVCVGRRPVVVAEFMPGYVPPP